MKAPVVGGGATAEPVEVTATEVAAAEVAADGAAVEDATPSEAHRRGGAGSRRR